MTYPFDVRTLPGRAFSSVLHEMASPCFGTRTSYTERGLRRLGGADYDAYTKEQRAAVEASKHMLAPLFAALRDGTAALVDADRTVVPRRVWLSGFWMFYRDTRGVDCLVALGSATRPQITYFNPEFVDPDGTDCVEKPSRRGKRAGGNTQYDDTEAVARATVVYNGMTKKSKRRAAQIVLDEVIAERGYFDGASEDAWLARIRRQI